MNKILLSIVFCLFSTILYSQAIIITKPVTVNDTTISKSFVKFKSDYNIGTKIMLISLDTYMSRSAMRNNIGTITVPEIPGIITLDLSADQAKSLSQLDNIARTEIKRKLKEINPTWTNADIKFIDN